MQEHEVKPIKAFIICPDIRVRNFDGIHQVQTRTMQAKLEEALRLAQSIHLDIQGHDMPVVQQIKPASLISGGHIERIQAEIEAKEIELVIMDAGLTPIQQRNLERALHCKVIDRTGLILEIFGLRAHTHEGRLQVELAALTFQRSRLVRSWTHLERQRGGFGFTGGPGESQIELDRRLIDQRIKHLEKQLQTVKRTRSLHRKARAKVPYPIIALVGYTNAGKSSLFNRLTGAKSLAKNMLFATLDPTMRAIALNRKDNIILSDTVGFITDLPTQLVAAFHATLEEVESADIILHVRDASSMALRQEKQDVLSVLQGLQLKQDVPMIEVMNKVDLIETSTSKRLDAAIWVSALTGEGMEDLLQAIDDALHQDLSHYQYWLGAGLQKEQYGAAYAWLFAHAKQLSLVKEDADTGHQLFKVTWYQQKHEEFQKKFMKKMIEGKQDDDGKIIALHR